MKVLSCNLRSYVVSFVVTEVDTTLNTWTKAPKSWQEMICIHALVLILGLDTITMITLKEGKFALEMYAPFQDIIYCVQLFSICNSFQIVPWSSVSNFINISLYLYQSTNQHIWYGKWGIVVWRFSQFQHLYKVTNECYTCTVKHVQLLKIKKIMITYSYSWSNLLCY